MRPSKIPSRAFFGAEDQTLQLRFSRVAGFPRDANASFSDFSACADEEVLHRVVSACSAAEMANGDYCP